MLNIVLPIAGAGSRFVDAGYTTPKPFIDVAGEPMIVKVLENLKYENARYILLARTEHMEKEPDLVKRIEDTYNAIFIPVDKLTEGAACTVLYAKDHIDNEEPLMIANSDQIVDMEISSYIEDCFDRKLDGSILTFVDKHRDPKWSFARIDEDGMVLEVKEKVVISEYATVGIYLYTEGKDFVHAASDMIAEDNRVNNEFYVCPTYNYLIREQKRIGIFNIEFDSMHGLGTPEDLNLYLEGLK